MLETILNGIIKAGWVLGPLMLTSLVGWYLVFNRFFHLMKMEWSGLRKWQKLPRHLDQEKMILKLKAGEKKTVAGEALLSIYEVRNQGRIAMESMLDEVMKFKIPELETSLSTLAILASAAPLMGLLGTVSGIVRTFQVISAFGTGNQALMSDSISESLMATQNGLLVAFPLLLMHVVLSSKAKAIEDRTLAAAHSLINFYSPSTPRPYTSPSLQYR